MKRRGLEPLTGDQTYQVWAISQGRPVILGFLGPATDGEAWAQ